MTDSKSVVAQATGSSNLPPSAIIEKGSAGLAEPFFVENILFRSVLLSDYLSDLSFFNAEVSKY